MEKQRKYLPTLSELIDRLSILSQKEVKIPEHRKEYAEEIKDVLYDIQLIIDENKLVFNAEVIRAICILCQSNVEIWHNESNYRRGIKEGNDLEKTHVLNGVRSRAKNIIQSILGGRKDYKTDCLAAEYTHLEPSW